MPDPFSIAGGALSLTSTLIKVHQEHARDPKSSPGLADIMKTIPGTVFEATGRIIAEVDKLEKDCVKADIDPKKTLDTLKTNKGFWLGRRRRTMDNFTIRVTAIEQELASCLMTSSQSAIAANQRRSSRRVTVRHWI
jgi:hypothetical protein